MASGRTTKAARCGRTCTSPLATNRRIASRTGVRDTLKAVGDAGFIQRGAGRVNAAHDLVGELQPQFL